MARKAREINGAGADHDDAFTTAFDDLARAVRRARGAQPGGAGEGLTLSQLALLGTLATREQARVAELAVEAGITASTATRILDALERRGIVVRTRAVEDRRAVAVTLSPAGRDLLAAQQEWMEERRRAFVASLPTEHRELVPELLHGLARLIDELAAGPRYAAAVPDATPRPGGFDGR
jgi:DNA-binding MarR family transcriptional regulator